MSSEELIIKGKMLWANFMYSVRIYYEDTDAGGIVYYANYLKFAERARTEYLRYSGVVSQQEKLEHSMCGFVVRHLEIDYFSPAKLDDLLNVSCDVLEVKGASVIMQQDITRCGEVLASMKVKVVYVNLEKKCPIRIPEDIVSKLKG